MWQTVAIVAIVAAIVLLVLLVHQMRAATSWKELAEEMLEERAFWMTQAQKDPALKEAFMKRFFPRDRRRGEDFYIKYLNRDDTHRT